MTAGLKDKYRKAIIDILRANERVEKVVLFGSRAMGTFTPTSDVDIALFGDNLTLTDHANLAAVIDELSIPQRVDILLHKSIKNEKLIEHIKRHGVEWYRRSWAMVSDWQHAIAHILGSLDDKIELNRRMNETLEAMARAIFKSWFVDFDPVHAKAEGRDSDLPKDIADLFPDSFEDSELGEIPKGWRETTIGAEFDLTMGQSPPGSTYNKIGAINKKQFEGLRWLSPPDDLVNEFDKIAIPLDERIEKNILETATLVALRDTLLPKLISGELRVPDAKKLVEN